MKILYFQHTTSLGGASWSLLQLVAEIGQYHSVCVAAAQDGPLVSHLRKLGAEVHICPALTTLNNMPSGWGWVRDAGWICSIVRWRAACRAAARICRDVRPDIVHINTMSLFHLSLGVKRAGSIPVVQHIREHWVSRSYDPRNRIRRMAIEGIDHVLSITRVNATQFGYPGPVTLLRNWPDFFSRKACDPAMARCGIPPGRKIVLVPGGRIRGKGTLIAIRAMRYVESADAVMLVLGGAGPLEAGRLRLKLGALAARFGILPYSHRIAQEARALIGKVVLVPVSEHMEAIMKACFVVVSPFDEPHFSKPTIEAGSVGKPVIASDYAEMRECVQDGETGILVPPGDVLRLAHAIDWLCANPDEATRMGKCGYDWITRHYSKERSITSVLNLYTALESEKS